MTFLEKLHAAKEKLEKASKEEVTAKQEYHDILSMLGKGETTGDIYLDFVLRTRSEADEQLIEFFKDLDLRLKNAPGELVLVIEREIRDEERIKYVIGNMFPEDTYQVYSENIRVGIIGSEGLILPNNTYCFIIDTTHHILLSSGNSILSGDKKKAIAISRFHSIYPFNKYHESHEWSSAGECNALEIVIGDQNVRDWFKASTKYHEEILTEIATELNILMLTPP